MLLGFSSAASRLHRESKVPCFHPEDKVSVGLTSRCTKMPHCAVPRFRYDPGKNLRIPTSGGRTSVAVAKAQDSIPTEAAEISPITPVRGTHPQMWYKPHS